MRKTRVNFSVNLLITLFLPLFLIFNINLRAHAAQINKIAAVVNGQVITMFDLQKEAIPHFIRARINPDDPAKSKEVDAILRQALDNMIQDILIAQEAKRINADVSDSDVNNELQRLMRERGVTQKQLEADLKKQNMTIDKLKEGLRKNLLRQNVLTREVGRRVIVTPQEISDYYNANKDKMYDRSGLHMGILVYHPKANASALSAQILSGKARFEDVCAKYSIAPNRDKGGDAGPIDWDRLNPEWEGRLTKMKPGDTTELFDLQGHKAQVHLFRPGGGEEKLMTLQEATPQIDAILRQPKARERFDDFIKQLRDKALINIRL